MGSSNNAMMFAKSTTLALLFALPTLSFATAVSTAGFPSHTRTVGQARLGGDAMMSDMARAYQERANTVQAHFRPQSVDYEDGVAQARFEQEQAEAAERQANQNELNEWLERRQARIQRAEELATRRIERQVPEPVRPAAADRAPVAVTDELAALLNRRRERDAAFRLADAPVEQAPPAAVQEAVVADNRHAIAEQQLRLFADRSGIWALPSIAGNMMVRRGVQARLNDTIANPADMELFSTNIQAPVNRSLDSIFREEGLL